MAATATKKSDLVLSDEVKELYDKCWKIAYDNVNKFGIDNRFLLKMKDPYEFSRLFGENRKAATEDMGKAEDALNLVFSLFNGMPEWIFKDSKTQKFFSDYIKENFGREVKVEIKPVAHMKASTDRVGVIHFYEANSLLDSVMSVWHEMAHLEEPFAKKAAELEAILMEAKPGPGGFIERYSKITGMSEEEVEKEIEKQRSMHSSFRALVFLVELYEEGKYRPTNSRVKECLDSSRFFVDKDMRRAYLRYSEGRAQSKQAELLESKDEELKIAVALNLIWWMAYPNPQFYSEQQGREKGYSSDAREPEGFRFYYTLQERLGKDRIRNFERVCMENGLTPGIDANGKLVVIETKKMKMFEVDSEKLKAGVTNIKELIIKPDDLTSKLPKNLN